MDGGGSFLCVIRILDHEDSGQHEAIRGLFQELLCAALSADLASVLFVVTLHVCHCPLRAPVGSSRRVRTTVIAVVGISHFSAKFPNSDSNHGHRSAWRYLVARCGGTIL